MGGILHTIRSATVSRTSAAVVLLPPTGFYGYYQFESFGPTLGQTAGAAGWNSNLSGTVTASAVRALVGTQSKLSTTSNYIKLFDTIPRYVTYTNGFTVEGFLYITGNAASYYDLIRVSNASGSQYITMSAYQNQAAMLLDSISGAGANLGTLGTFPTNQWVHIFLTFYNDLCWVGFNGKYEQAQTGTYKRNILLPGFSEIDCAALGYGPGNYNGPNPNMWCDAMAVHAGTRGYQGGNLTSTNLSGTYTIPTPSNGVW